MSDTNLEILRLRIEDFDRNFYSLRAMEWQVYLQLYVGFAAVGAGFAFLRTFSQPLLLNSRALGGCTLVALAVCLVTAAFLSLRIQERLDFCREMKNECFKLIHTAHPGTNVPEPDWLNKPKYKFVWCKAPMRVLAAFFWVLTSLGVVVATNW